MRIATSTQVPLDFFRVMTVLKKIISSMKTDITDQREEQKNNICAEQENTLGNAEMLLTKRKGLIAQFSKNNIISKDEKFYDAPKKSEKGISEKSDEKSDQSILKWVQVSKDRFDFIKLKINKNKGLTTMIRDERYTQNDVNKLVNKIAENKIGRNNATKEYNNLVNKTEQIDKLRSTKHRQKMLEIFNNLGEIFNGPPKKEGHRLKILTPDQMLSRLPINLAQLEAGNNSEKLKNEIRQILYSLYNKKNLKNNYIKV